MNVYLYIHIYLGGAPGRAQRPCGSKTPKEVQEIVQLSGVPEGEKERERNGEKEGGTEGRLALGSGAQINDASAVHPCQSRHRVSDAALPHYTIPATMFCLSFRKSAAVFLVYTSLGHMENPTWVKIMCRLGIGL